MKVGVNLLWLVPGVVGGSEEYAVRTLAALLDRRADDVEVVVFARRSLRSAHPELARRVRLVELPVGGHNRVVRVVAENTWLRWQVRRHRCDLVHHVGGRQPVLAGRVPTVVTVHDLQPIELPENFGRVKRWYLTRALPRSLRSARLVIAVSADVRDRIARLYGVASDRLAVVSSGIDADRPVTPGPLPAPVDRIVVDGRRFVLYPAVTHPHKDHATLIDAITALRAGGLDVVLVLTGGRGRAHPSVMHRVAGSEGAVLHLGRIERGQLDRLLAAASALVFPSRYEGFGIPVLEAMAMGTPAVVSDLPVMREVAGDAAVYVQPGDVAGWSAAIRAALDSSPSEQDVARRRTQASTFSWFRSGEQLLAAYRRAGTARCARP